MDRHTSILNTGQQRWPHVGYIQVQSSFQPDHWERTRARACVRRWHSAANANQAHFSVFPMKVPSTSSKRHWKVTRWLHMLIDTRYAIMSLHDHPTKADWLCWLLRGMTLRHLQVSLNNHKVPAGAPHVWSKKKKKSTMGGRGSNKLFQYLQDHKRYLLI